MYFPVRYPPWVYIAVFAVIIVAIVIIQMRKGNDNFQPGPADGGRNWISSTRTAVWPDCADKKCEICNETTDNIPMKFVIGSANPVTFPHGFTCTISSPKTSDIKPDAT